MNKKKIYNTIIILLILFLVSLIIFTRYKVSNFYYMDLGKNISVEEKRKISKDIVNELSEKYPEMMTEFLISFNEFINPSEVVKFTSKYNLQILSAHASNIYYGNINSQTEFLDVKDDLYAIQVEGKNKDYRDMLVGMDDNWLIEPVWNAYLIDLIGDKYGIDYSPIPKAPIK